MIWSNVMEPPYEVTYCDPASPLHRYLFHCQPVRLVDGRFKARLLVSPIPPGTRIGVTLNPDVASFESEEEAADFAYALGRKWVEGRELGPSSIPDLYDNPEHYGPGLSGLQT